MEKELKRLTRKLSYVIDEFRKLDPEMPAQRIATFFTISLREGLAVMEVANLTGQTTGSATRNLQALGVDKAIGKRMGKNGVGLIKMVDDPVDGRKKNCYLTPAGENLLLKMENHFKE